MATSIPPNGKSPELSAALNADVAKGAVVHTFDPNSSPAEKGAAAGKAKSQLQSVTAQQGSNSRQLAVDPGTRPPPPTITIQDADVEKPVEQVAPPNVDEQPVPGKFPDAPAPAIPDWFRVGWRAVSGIDQPAPEGVERDKTILEAWLSEMYYGEWYHNAAIIFFAVAASHFMTLFHLGWGWLFLLLISCSAYYSMSMERVRRRSRDDIQRELVKSRLINEHETADWINNFLDRFWLIYEPVLSETVVSSVDQILSTNTPAFLDSIRMTTFTLGNKAPRIERVRTYPRTDDDIVTMDWGLSFTPSDITDITPIEAKKRVNPKIVLSIRIGKGLAGTNIPILLEDINFSGNMMIRLKLMTNFPHVQVVDISFTEKPVFDYVLKPIGGETFGFDIANVPGLSSFIRNMVHSILGPMMYAPNAFTLNLEQMLSGAPLDSAIGVLQVTLRSARGIKATKIGGGTPDPYVSLSISQRAELARTKHKDSTTNPTWNETKFLLVNSLSEILTFSIMDHNDHRADSELGAASQDLSSLADDALQEGIEAKILKDGKDRGLLRFDLSFYPVLKPAKLADGTEEPLPETKVGIVRLTLHQSKDLDFTKSMSGDLNPFAKVMLGGATSPIHFTKRVKHTNNPVWESSTEFLCMDKQSSVITVNVVDDREFLKDPVIGYLSIKLEDLIEAKKVAGRDWWPLSGCKTGRLRMSAEWKPLNMSGSIQGADQYVPPIGIVRLWVQKAVDVKNVEAALGGKSDPYVRVQVNNITTARTEVLNNNLNPEWDQILYIPVHSLRETLLLEVMDYQHLTRDRSLGSVELHVDTLAKEASDIRYPYVSTGKRTVADPLQLDKNDALKGTLHYVAEFVPSLNMKGITFKNETGELSGARIAGEDVSEESSSAESGQDEIIPSSTTIKSEPPTGHTKNVSSIASVNTVVSNASEGAPSNHQGKGTDSSEGVTISKADLLTHQHGIIIFDIIGGQLAKKARLEVLLDDGYWPSCSSPKARSSTARWDFVGEGFVKELDFGRIWLRLNENDENEKESIVGELKMDAKEFLQRALDGPTRLTLVDQDERLSSIIDIAAKYVPVEIQLEPRESINNQGVLTVELIDGKGIHGADRSGKSDPFVVFTLNDEKVYKSQTKKKTLTPEWNETFNIQIPSRVAGNLSLEVFDWNQIEQSKSLGTADIKIDDLEPFHGVQRTLQLMHAKHGTKGEIQLRLNFQPEIIARSRKNTSTFSTAGRAMTQLGALPYGGAKGVVTGVGSAGHKVTGLFKRDFAAPEAIDEVQEAPTGQISQAVDSGSAPTPFPTRNEAMSSSASVQPEPGTLKVTVLGAKDLAGAAGGDVKPYVVLKLGDKEHKTKHTSRTASPEWNESFTFGAGPETTTLSVGVFDHKTLGKDKLLADGDVDIWRHVQPVGTTTSDVWAELRDGQGLIRLRLEFDRGNIMGRGGSMISLDRNGTSNPPSPSRFISLRKRSGEE
ncbi:tricalbin [Sistotremastrum suecicum HHB10207 ss-3]|uniref:Tricalbin n=1 Tax=Sistotremastrum suecicum HHB10207 ss-3 TaxID=1314776 RepID=A0A166J946_9AGAM|nr:tricalbin [Sistotremastrum suecicum HHB10207 ss-3]